MALPGLPSESKRRQAQVVSAVVSFALAASMFAAMVLRPFDIVAVLWFLLGAATLGIGYYLQKGEFFAWGVGVIVAALAVLAGVGLGALYVAGMSVATLAVLYLFRRPYGVGLWKVEQARKEKEEKERRAKRSANPKGLRCPSCGSTHLYVAEDRSAFCEECKAGTISIGG